MDTLQRKIAEYNANKIDWAEIILAPICVVGICALGIAIMIIL